ncbi:MAG TPA: aldo/keto reductase [Candidatus Limnocylindria bacterium]|nr:aldo/keto reductase [Candidatus Limnocylindria bacterium]
MNHRRLGRTGLKVSEISLGSWTTYGGSVGESDAVRLIHHAFELGINLFDTADVYLRGAAERVLGAALKSLPREQVVVATKVMGRVWDGPLGAGLSRKHMFDAMDQSLKRLGLDYVDLYQLHAPDPHTPLEETLQALEDLLRAGKTRYVGFSNFDKHPPLDARALALQKARGWERFASSQPRYNLLDRSVEARHLALCRRYGVGMIVYSPLSQGVLTNKYAGGAKPEGSRATGAFAHFLESEKALTPENVAAAERFAAWTMERGGTPAQFALAWVLRRPEVASAIIGATRPEQLDENLKAIDLKLGAPEWRAVEAAIRGPAAAAPRARRTGRTTARASKPRARRRR